jgi:excisionase family DNA binding protein
MIQPENDDTEGGVERRSRQIDRRAYSVEETARALGICPNSVRAAILKKEIPHVRIGRRLLVPVEALEQLLDVQRP